jgi:hypothetical protein
VARAASPDPSALVDLERYPILALDSARGREVVAEGRRERARSGMVVLPGFLLPAAIERAVAEAEKLAPRGHFSEVHGTPYVTAPDASLPEGHPRRTLGRTALTAIAYDLFAEQSPLRALYEWDPLMEFFRVLLEKDMLYRYADPFGALNVASMRSGDELAWHFDQTDFVVSIALQSSEAGGEFECVPHVRSAGDERYAAVGAVLAGDRTHVRTIPMTPGTLMLFEGRHSIHRVAPVRGERPRFVALLAYDTRPGTDSTPLLKAVRYGRQPGEPPPA